LESVSESFSESTETTVKVVSFMKSSMTKITETYEAFSSMGEEKLSVNLISNILAAMDEEFDSDTVIERAALYSSTIETITTIFESAFSSSTTNWFEMFSSSSSTISKSYSSVSSTFRKEAGTMVVKIISAIKDEYESDSSISSSGSLISKIVTEIETIISASTILTDEESFNAGMLIVEVTKGITESIMKSTTSADSGRVMVSSMESLNIDITMSEESVSSANRVDQVSLFKKVSTVIMEQFEESSTVSPSTLMLEVSKTINKELGSTVASETETIKLYGNNLKAIFSVYKDLSSLTEKEEKEAKSIIRTIMVFSNVISSSVDAGEIVVTTITALVAFNEGSTFKTPEVKTTMGVVETVLKDLFGNDYPDTEEGRVVSKTVKRALKRIL